MSENSFRLRFSFFILAVLAFTIIYGALPYVGALFIAVILGVVFYPLQSYLVGKLRLNKTFSAVLVMLLSVVIILIPIIVLVPIVVAQAAAFITPEKISALFDYLSSIMSTPAGVQLSDNLRSIATKSGSTFVKALLGSIGAVTNLFTNLLIAYFIFFYVLITRREVLRKLFRQIIPFNSEHTTKLLHKFKSIVRATVYSTILVAILQGTVLGVAFAIFGVPGAVLWGFIAAILSIIPLVGAPVVWIPAVVIYLLSNNYLVAVGILGAGIVISLSDNFVRPIFQKKFGDIHPLTSILGIFIGLNLFGVLGIIFGPLLVDIFLETAIMFKKEFI